MGVTTMCFAVFGFLSPSNRGGLMTAMLVLFVVMGASMHAPCTWHTAHGTCTWLWSWVWVPPYW